MRKLQALVMTFAALPLVAARPVGAPPRVSSGAVFALIDNNEWCPGGSVYLDLRTGSYMLYPKLARPVCTDPSRAPAVEHGTLANAALKPLREAYEAARATGLRRQGCDIVVSNGGPLALVITAPNYSVAAPEELGCWSVDAKSLYQKIYEVFGSNRASRK